MFMRLIKRILKICGEGMKMIAPINQVSRSRVVLDPKRNFIDNDLAN